MISKKSSKPEKSKFKFDQSDDVDYGAFGEDDSGEDDGSDEEDDSDDSDSSSDAKTKPEKIQSSQNKEGPAKSNGNTPAPGNKEEEVNDFKIDKERIKAAHEFEKVCSRLVFDPDNDGFNFGYERALTFKVRTNMFKIIRKEIISSDFKLFDQCVESLS